MMETIIELKPKSQCAKPTWYDKWRSDQTPLPAHHARPYFHRSAWMNEQAPPAGVSNADHAIKNRIDMLTTACALRWRQDLRPDLGKSNARPR